MKAYRRGTRKKTICCSANALAYRDATNYLIPSPPSLQVPNNTARCRVTVGSGSAKYVPEHNALVWRVRRFPGGSEVTLNGEVELIMSTKNKAWVVSAVSRSRSRRLCVRSVLIRASCQRPTALTPTLSLPSSPQRPPISVDFQVPMFTASGLHVRSLKIYERSNYQTTKWVRYVTRAGSYQIRI